jgi:hypothetical protein
MIVEQEILNGINDMGLKLEVKNNQIMDSGMASKLAFIRTSPSVGRYVDRDRMTTRARRSWKFSIKTTIKA